MSKPEFIQKPKQWYFIMCAFFIVAVNLAYINYALHANASYRYTGANLYAAADKLVYMSMVEQGREGILFMKNLHTTEPQKGLMLSPHWFIVGQTAKLLGVDNNVSYQLYRLVFIGLFLWLLWAVIAKLWSRSGDTVLAAFFVLFSGGLGWFRIMQNPEILAELKTIQKFFYTPIDIYVTEGNTFLNFSQSPLFSLSQLLLLLIPFLYIQHRENAQYRWDIAVSLLALFLIVIHPYDAPIIFAVLGSWTLWYFWRSRSWLIARKFLILGIGVVGGAAFNAYVLAAEPVMGEWLKQNLVYSPFLKMYLWGYGLLLPFWLVGLYDIWKTKRDHPWWMFVAVWSTIVWLLLYAPVTISRRFINGFHIALALTAYLGFRYLMRACHLTVTRALVSFVAGVALFSHLVFFFIVNLYFNDNIYSYGYYYISASEDRVIEFLRVNTSRQDPLLVSDEMTAFAITSELNRTVFRGHEHQTPRSHLKEQELTWFFFDQDAKDVVERKLDFLEGEGISYIVMNKTRLEHDPQWLNQADFLRVVYTSPDITIYRVSPPRYQ